MLEKKAEKIYNISHKGWFSKQNKKNHSIPKVFQFSSSLVTKKTSSLLSFKNNKLNFSVLQISALRRNLGTFSSILTFAKCFGSARDGFLFVIHPITHLDDGSAVHAPQDTAAVPDSAGSAKPKDNHQLRALWHHQTETATDSIGSVGKRR